MKGITFNIIVFVLIALATIIIFLSIFNSITSNFLGKQFCKIYRVFDVLPLPKKLKPNVEGCSGFPIMKRIVLEKEMVNANTIMKFIKDCKEKSEEVIGSQTFICYEIFIKEVQNLDEKNITRSIKENSLCEFLPNNIIEEANENFDCGEENSINWKIGKMQGKNLTIIIKYNGDNRQIEVI